MVAESTLVLHLLSNRIDLNKPFTVVECSFEILCDDEDVVNSNATFETSLVDLSTGVSYGVMDNIRFVTSLGSKMPSNGHTEVKEIVKSNGKRKVFYVLIPLSVSSKLSSGTFSYCIRADLTEHYAWSTEKAPEKTTFR
jgi:hypothetical protein